MTKLLDLIRDGDRIVSAYMISKDALVIQVNYPPSAENVETLFDSEREPLAKAGFRNAPSLLAHPVWMTREGAPYWQKVEGSAGSAYSHRHRTAAGVVRYRHQRRFPHHWACVTRHGDRGLL
jgi:hypothetical protein